MRGKTAIAALLTLTFTSFAQQRRSGLIVAPADLADREKVTGNLWVASMGHSCVGPAMVALVKRFQAGKLPGMDTLVVPPDDRERVGLS